jgi:CubicO group peptidase (beta-lactamase class C family)
MKHRLLQRALQFSVPTFAVLCVNMPYFEQAAFAQSAGTAVAPITKSSAKPADVAARMQEFVERKQVSGAVTLVAQKGRVLRLDAVGEADLKTHRPMAKNTMFAIASMTKPITATALMILQDEGKLSFDDPVSKYLPEFKGVTLAGRPPRREITLHDLVTHTSGVVGKQEMEGTLRQTAEMLARRPLGFEPGTRWEYSPGLNVCGRVIEVVSGQPYEEFLRDHIFRPLNMLDTTFHPTAEQHARAAKLYAFDKQSQSLVPGTHWLFDVNDQTTPNPSGGLQTTAMDLFRFYQMILNGGELDGHHVVSAKAVRQMTSVQTGDLKTGFTPGCAWGLGWCLVREPQDATKDLSPGSFGHGGAFGTQGWIDPQRQMIVVLLIQRTGMPNGDASDIRRALQEAAVANLE